MNLHYSTSSLMPGSPANSASSPPLTTNESSDLFPGNTFFNIFKTLSEGVLIINLKCVITHASSTAAIFLGVEESSISGVNLSKLNWLNTDNNNQYKFPIQECLQLGIEQNNIILGLKTKNKELSWLSFNCRPLFANGTISPFAAIITIKKVDQTDSFGADNFFSSFLNNSPIMDWIYDDSGNLIYANPHFGKTLGFEGDIVGKNIKEIARPEELSLLIEYRINQVLATGKTMVAEDTVTDKNGVTRFYISHWFLIPAHSIDKKLIGGHAIDVTNQQRISTEMQRINERNTYAANASSDAIWDLDVATQTIYRSDTFYKFSGYVKNEILPTFKWLKSKVHPKDKKKLQKTIDTFLNNNQAQLQCEYQLKVADGSYRYIIDKAFGIYEAGKLIRVIGAMQDITAIKVVDARQLEEEVQKQKIINKTTIEAQENERNRISGELHDNVNQLLMSAKIHISVAKKNTEDTDIMLDKASEYILMAVEEIRDLSKKLNASIISVLGLEKCIKEILDNMLLSKNIQTFSFISKRLIKKLSYEQQLMIYRIIQEQTTNIIKYSKSTETFITLREHGSKAEMIITDNGQGFNKSKRLGKGLGFTNIFNRVEAYGGNVQITTAPKKGCTLQIIFPITDR